MRQTSRTTIILVCFVLRSMIQAEDARTFSRPCLYIMQKGSAPYATSLRCPENVFPPPPFPTPPLSTNMHKHRGEYERRILPVVRPAGTFSGGVRSAAKKLYPTPCIFELKYTTTRGTLVNKPQRGPPSPSKRIPIFSIHPQPTDVQNGLTRVSEIMLENLQASRFCR